MLRALLQTLQQVASSVRYTSTKQWHRGYILSGVCLVLSSLTGGIATRASAQLPRLSQRLSSDGAQNDLFGNAVASSANYLLVGANGKANYTGAAYLYTLSGTVWNAPTKLLPGDGSVGDNFGSAVALNGSSALIGASFKNNSTGGAYFFRRIGNSWPQTDAVAAADAQSGSSFGFAVSLSGNTAVISAPDSNNSTGAVYIFVYNGSRWVQQSKIVPTDAIANDTFGWSVSLSGNVLAATSPGANGGLGAAYVFSRSGITWTQQAKLKVPNSLATDFYGYAVVTNGSLVYVAAPGYNKSAGIVYQFFVNGTTGVLQSSLSPYDVQLGALFGTSLSLSGNYLMVGAPYTSGKHGAAYIYDNSSLGLVKLLPLDVQFKDNFGWSVAANGNIFAGSALTKNPGTGVNSGVVYTSP